MSKDLFKDLKEMHSHYGFDTKIDALSSKDLFEFLKFRLDFIKEEYEETVKAYNEKDPEEIVDGLIDIIVVAVGTLDAFKIDGYKAWDEVHKANMSKDVGVKEGRENKLGLPDLIKPTKASHGYDWVAPSHIENYGLLNKAFE